MNDQVINEQNINIERLLRAVLNHHVSIDAVKQRSVWMQDVVESIKVTDPDWLQLIFEFAKANYIEHLGFQGLSESDECTYVTCSVSSLLFYQFIREKNLSEKKFNDFLFNARNKNVEFFDISFPEDFY
jgi:hypothetical protein